MGSIIAYSAIETVVYSNQNSRLENVPDTLLGDAIKGLAIAYHSRGGKWNIPASLAFVELGFASGADAVICPIELSLSQGNKWIIEMIRVEGPGYVEVENPKKKLYSELKMKNYNPIKLNPTNDWFGLIQGKLWDQLCMKIATAKFKDSLPLLRFSSAKIGAAAKVLMEPCTTWKSRLFGLFVSADLLNLFAGMDHARADTLHLVMKNPDGHHFGNVKLSIRHEGHKKAQPDNNVVTRTWYPNGNVSFPEFSEQFEKVYSMHASEHAGAVQSISVSGTPKYK